MKKGMFITFEGADGSGKTTQIELLKKYLLNNNIDFVFTREPGGTIISEAIREIILDKTYDEMTNKTEVLLYAASRAQHVEQYIKPLLEQGKIVICDRYIDSSVVYQGIARGIGVEEVFKINSWATNSLQPDITILLDIDVSVSIKRKVKQKELDRLELQKEEFHKKVIEGYRMLANKEKGRFLIVDASLQVEEIHQIIIDYITKNLEREV